MNNNLSLACYLCWVALWLVGSCFANPSSNATAPASRYYQSQPGAGYQQLANTPAVAATLCAVPRPDTVPLQFQGAQGQPIWLQLSNEQGNLRWWNSDFSESALLLSDAQSPAAVTLAAQMMPGTPLLIAEASGVQNPVTTQQGASTNVIWHDPVAHQFQLAELADLQKPQQGWRWSPPLPQQTAWLQSPVLHQLEGEEPVLLINSSTAAQALLWLLHAEKGTLLAEFDLNDGYQRGHRPRTQLAELTAAPAALDLDGDGALDRIYQIDRQGQLLRLDVSNRLSYQSSVVADLSDSDAVFDQTILAARALLPVDNSTNKLLVQKKAVDVLVLVAQKQQQFQLLVLFLPEQVSTPLLYKDLVAKTTAAVLQINAQTTPTKVASAQNTGQGWHYQLPGAPVALPEIVAGVIYLPLQQSATQGATAICQQARLANQLLALHLYQASAVYTDAVIKVQMQVPLQLVQLQNGTLALQDATKVLVLDELRGIHSQCEICTEKLSVQQLSEWRQLALFRQEEVY
jgi:hypothetical protein